jgi:hypothetical protein
MRRPASVNNNLSRARLFWGSRKGACPLAGGAAVFAAWGEPARPGFPFRETGKGSKIPSLLPQAMNSVYSRFITSLHHRRFALLPFALFVEQLAPVPVGVLNILFGCCHLKLRTEHSPRRKSFRLDLAVTRTRRFAKNYNSSGRSLLRDRSSVAVAERFIDLRGHPQSMQQNRQFS